MPSLLHERYINQLDGLVVFMQLCDQRFFEQLTSGWNELEESGGNAQPPATYEEYEQFVLRSALLLGVAYAEAYLADALREVLRLKPIMLASRKKQVAWETVVKSDNLKLLIDVLIEKELLEFTHNSIDGMLEYMQDKLSLSSPYEDDFRRVKAAAIVRNLITHNSAICNSELAILDSQFSHGSHIRLSSELVHGYGLAGRALMRNLDEQLVKKYSIASGD